MKKIWVLSFSLLVLGFTAIGLLSGNYVIQQFLGLSEPYIEARLLLVLVLVMYTFLSEARTVAMRLIMVAGGILALGFGLAAFVSPVLFGSLDQYVPLGDVFIFLEGGILALLLAVELPLSQPRRAIPFTFLRTQFLVRKSSDNKLLGAKS